MFRLAIVTCVIAAASLVTHRASAQIAWQHDVQQAYQLAREQNKLVVLHFWAEWCMPCRRLDSFVFNHPQVAEALSKQVIAVKLNIDEHRELAMAYNIRSIPTDVLVNANGQVIARRPSPSSADAYLRMIESWSTASPSGNTLAAQLEAASAGQVALENPEQCPIEPASAPPMPATPQALVVAPADGAAIQWSSHEAMLQNAPSPLAPREQQASATSPMSAPPSGALVQPSTAQAWASQPPSAGGPSQPPAAQPSPVIAQNPHVGQPPASPPSVAPGLDGFCPVSLFMEKRWIKGDPRWGCFHRGRLYLFASVAARDEFMTKPDHYAPAMVGYDPVAYQQTGSLVNGQRSLGVFYKEPSGDTRVILFASAETRAAFEKSPEQFLNTVHQALATSDQSLMR
jgi:protein disulfide-isomerase